MATKKRTTVFIGTEIKLNVHIDPIDGFTMGDNFFSVDVFCSPKRTIHVTKDDAIRIDGDNYVIRIDTEQLGAGELKCKVIADVVDKDFEDSIRTEVYIIDTNIDIVKNL